MQSFGANRTRYIMYRTAPTSWGYNSSAETNTNGQSPPPPPPSTTYDTVTLLITLKHNPDHMEHVDFISTVLRSNVGNFDLDMNSSLTNIRADTRINLWRHLGHTKKIKDLGLFLHPFFTTDEFILLIETICPVLKQNYHITESENKMKVTCFSIFPTDTELLQRLALYNQSNNTEISILCMEQLFVFGGSCMGPLCNECTLHRHRLLSLFFDTDKLFQNPSGMTTDYCKLVTDLEKKLLSLGHLKTIMVTTKMQSIYNRMSYIEEKYKHMQHNLLTDGCYDGMLNDIEHLENMIRNIAVQIPVTYMEGRAILQRLIESNSHQHGVVTQTTDVEVSNDACS